MAYDYSHMDPDLVLYLREIDKDVTHAELRLDALLRAERESDGN